MPDAGRRPHAVRAFLTSLELFGIKLGLEPMRRLLGALGHPHLAYPSIVIAGTNGKGSTAAMIERGLREAGYRTGRYTSPHLVDIEERIAVSGASIDPEAFDEAAMRIQHASAGLPALPSFFEATTAVALEAFKVAKIDIAVLEVGLGGRLDATNAVDAQAAGITAIDFDHQAHLGHTLEAIAREKAGVIKPGAMVVLGENPVAVDAVVADRCTAVGADLVRASRDITLDVHMADGRATLTLGTPTRRYAGLTLGLRGRHQVANAVTAIRLLETATARGLCVVNGEAIRAGVARVEWPARLESRVLDEQDVIIDGAHNPAGARALASYLQDTFGRRLPVVLGVMADKDIDGIVRALAPRASIIVCTRANAARAATPEALAARVAAVAPDVARATEPDPRRAIRLGSAHGSPVVVAGSLYLAGEVRAVSS